jgi:DNA-binding transcriptional LysR family regulator
MRADTGMSRGRTGWRRRADRGSMDGPQAAQECVSGQTVVEIIRLADEPFVMVSRSWEPTVFDTCVGLCSRAGFSPRIEQEAQQIHTIVKLVAAGLGVAMAPASLANLQRPGVVYRPLRDSGGVTMQTGLTWRSDNTSAIVHAFIRSARDTVRPDE